MKEIKEMGKEELMDELKKLRESRKRGYTQAPKTRKRKDNPFDGISTELAEKLLAELQKGG